MACPLPPCNFGKVVACRGLVGTSVFIREKLPKVKFWSRVNFSPKHRGLARLRRARRWDFLACGASTTGYKCVGAALGGWRGRLSPRLLAARAHAFVSSSKDRNQIKFIFEYGPCGAIYKSNRFFYSVERPLIVIQTPEVHWAYLENPWVEFYSSVRVGLAEKLSILEILDLA